MRYSRLPEAPGSFGETALVTGLPFGLAMGSLWVLSFSSFPARRFGFRLLTAALGVVCGVLFGVSVGS